MVYRDWGYFGAKSKGYDAIMKRGGKESLLKMSYVLRNKRISSKKLKCNEFMQSLKRYPKQNKLLSLLSKRWSEDVVYSCVIISIK